MKSLRCPRCRLVNPSNAIWCDCGHVFDLEAARQVSPEASRDGRDRPVRGVLICPRCGVINPLRSARCDCGHPFDLERKRATQSQAAADAVVDCPSCSRGLRLKPPFEVRQFTCPSCACRFTAQPTDHGSIQLGVVVDPSGLTPYYELLGVSATSSEQDLRSAYRRRISEYHPDKVAVLGKELRKLAEEKTKRINEAYRAIVAFRSGQGSSGT